MVLQMITGIVLTAFLATGMAGDEDGQGHTNLVPDYAQVTEDNIPELTSQQRMEIQIEIADLQEQIFNEEQTMLAYKNQAQFYESRLREAEADLATAQSKKVMVYRDGEYAYENDPDAVNEALEKVGRYQNEVDYYMQMAERYEDRVLVLEEQMEALEALLN